MKAGWETRALGEVCQIRTGKKDVNQGNPAGKYPFFTCAAEHTYSDVFSFDTEALLIAGNGDVGQVSYYKGKFEAYQRTYVVSDFVNVLPRFLYLILDGKLKETVSKQKLGNTMPYIKMGMLTDFSVPLPPLPEQHRIVAILDKAFDGIAKAKTAAEANLQNARAVFESHLQWVFKNKNWKRAQIQDVCAEIFAGGDAPKENFSLEKSEKFTIPIFANAVKKNGLYGYTNFARVTKPSITISARGSGTGHTEIRFESFLPIVRLIVLIPNTSVINLEFLKYSIDNLEILRSGSAIPQLTVPMIKEYHIPLPTLPEQLEIISKLEVLFAAIQHLESLYQRKIAALDELKKSLLHQAFSGAL